MTTALALTLRHGTHAARLARDVLGLFKLRIGVMIMLTALVGFAFTPGPSLSLAQVLVLALSVMVSSASAGAFNQYVEAETDKLMARTRTRAFVTGALPHTPAWLVVIAALARGLGRVGLVGAQCLGGALRLPRRVLLRRRLHRLAQASNLAQHRRRRPRGQLRGAGRRGGGGPAIGAVPLLLALVLFLWTPPHFWSLAIANRDRLRRRWRADAAGGRRHRARRAGRVLEHGRARRRLAAAGLLRRGSRSILSVRPIGGGYFLRKAWVLARRPSRKTAMASFFASLLQLSLVLAGASLDGLLR